MQNKTLERIMWLLIIYSVSLDHIGLMKGKMCVPPLFLTIFNIFF